MDPRLIRKGARTRRRILGGGVAGLALAGAGLWAALALAQPIAPPAAGPAAPLAPTQGPPPPSLGPVVAPPPQADESDSGGADDAQAPKAKALAPVVLHNPERSPAAIIGMLDKVTAETVRFEAPVGQKVRYRGLVFETKACETWDPRAPHPRPSAYLVIQSDSALEAGLAAAPLFEGWMFSQAPAVHALQHPVYDAWVEGCAPPAAPPPA